MSECVTVNLSVNGAPRTVVVDPRVSLAECLRRDLRLTGLHLGCEHGVCGACNVLVDGRSVRSCLMLAVQARSSEVATVEGLAGDRRFAILRDCFVEYRALQCGFCTPGILMTAMDFLTAVPDPNEQEVKEALSGNICRCTGYQPIIAAILAAAGRMRLGFCQDRSEAHEA